VTLAEHAIYHTYHYQEFLRKQSVQVLPRFTTVKICALLNKIKALHQLIHLLFKRLQI
jgi:hypothetical protein